MKDEEYVFYQDIKEKKSTGRGAFHKKGGSKSKKCTLPHEYLSKKEREKMNGECKTWNLNEFYTWEEFKSMPADIQEAYLVTLVGKYRASANMIGMGVFGLKSASIYRYFKNQGYYKNIKFYHKMTEKDIKRFNEDLAAWRTPQPKDNWHSALYHIDDKQLKLPTPGALQQATFTIHGFDWTVLEYIQDLFADRDVTIFMTVSTER